ncbi:hypothetical protein CASFOL_012843 [Castilleja foliolosa]|uniref:Uncharacterized protein n=1 Tax=Castilleja foliolosa TaxID=1961234 RepID=A0ABD3DI86_9LAMI
MAIPKNKNKIGIGNNGQLYPGIQEDPRTRLSLIVKAYSIMCIQLLLIFGMCLVMTLTHPVRDFIRTSAGSHLRFAITAITFI